MSSASRRAPGKIARAHLQEAVLFESVGQAVGSQQLLDRGARCDSIAHSDEGPIALDTLFGKIPLLDRRQIQQR